MVYEKNNLKLKEFIQNIHNIVSFDDEGSEDTRVGFVNYCLNKGMFSYIHHPYEDTLTISERKNLADLPWHKRECYTSQRSIEVVQNGFHIHNAPVMSDNRVRGILTIHTRKMTDKKRSIYRYAHGLLSKYYSAVSEENHRESGEMVPVNNFSTLSMLDLVTKISQVIIATDSIEDISNRLYREMKRNFGECAIGIAVNSPKEKKLKQCFYYEFDRKLDFDDIPYPRVDSSKLLKAVLNEREYTYEVMDQRGNDIIVGCSPRAAYFTPLTMNGRVLGAFTYQIFERSHFSDIEIDLCRKLIPYMTITLNNTLQNNALLETNTKLKYLSSYDSLTELYNRRYFYEVFDRKYRKAFSQGRESHLVLFDLDNFKGVNDNFSHTVGDAAIVRITAHIRKIFLGSGSVLGRYGGDEFLAGIVDLSTDTILSKLKKIREDIQAMEIPCDNEGNHVGVSIGLLKLDTPLPLRDAFHMADNCLYTAKSSVDGIAISTTSDLQGKFLERGNINEV